MRSALALFLLSTLMLRSPNGYSRSGRVWSTGQGPPCNRQITGFELP